jgi:nitrate reductase NapAB chaperone NapD
MNVKLKQELNNLKSCDITTSDLQGVVLVLSKEYNIDEDELLEYIYEVKP